MSSENLFGDRKPSDDEQPMVMNITDWGLSKLREHYKDNTITKGQAYEYIYGVLHATDYREKYEENLKRELPRIPLAPDFWEFAKAGARLLDIHINYETVPQHPLQPCHPHVDVSRCIPRNEPIPDKEWKIEKQMKRIYEHGNNGFKRIAGVLINRNLGLIGIPPKANGYKIAGAQPIEYAIRKLKVTTNKQNQIINDGNDMFENPVELRAHIQRLIWLSIESATIISDLPLALPPEDGSPSPR